MGLHMSRGPSTYEVVSAKRALLKLCTDAVMGLDHDEPRCRTELVHLLCLASDGTINAQVQLVKCGLEAPRPKPSYKMALFCSLGFHHDEAVVHTRVLFRDLAFRLGSYDKAWAAVSASDGRCSELWAQMESEGLRGRQRAREVDLGLAPRMPEGCKLEEHQLQAVVFSRDCSRRMLLADDMGLGKTISALAVVMDIGSAAFPLLITCPSSVVGSWERECRKWLVSFGAEIVVVDRALNLMTRDFVITEEMKEALSEDEIRRATVDFEVAEEARVAGVADEIERICHSRRPVILISSWDQAALRQRALFHIRPRTVIGDESHYIKNIEANRTRAMLRLRLQADNRMLLSGTPDPNGRSKEYYSQLRFLDEGLVSHNWYEFARDYCGPRAVKVKGGRQIWTYDGRSNELSMARILSRAMLRRKKSSLDLGLPNKTRYAVPVELTEADTLYLNSVRDEVKARFATRALELEKELMAQGVCDEEILQRTERVLGAEAVTMAGALRVAVGLVKARNSRPLLEQMKEEGHAPVIFTAHEVVRAAMVEMCTEVFGKGVLTGSGATPARKRTQMVARFQAGKSPAIVVTRAFKEGITLTRSARLISVERFWIPGEEMQMEDRVHRIGQMMDVILYYLLAPGTVDDVVDKIVTWKEESVARQEGSFQKRLVQWLRAA